eukprot:ctg_1194.g259
MTTRRSVIRPCRGERVPTLAERNGVDGRVRLRRDRRSGLDSRARRCVAAGTPFCGGEVSEERGGVNGARQQVEKAKLKRYAVVVVSGKETKAAGEPSGLWDTHRVAWRRSASSWRSGQRHRSLFHTSRRTSADDLSDATQGICCDHSSAVAIARAGWGAGARCGAVAGYRAVGVAEYGGGVVGLAARSGETGD